MTAGLSGHSGHSELSGLPADSEPAALGGLGGLGAGRTVALSAAEVHVYDVGRPDGPAVVFLHGFLTSAVTWRQIWPTLADRYRVVLVDLPGSGRSPDPRGEWSADRAADLLAELLAALDLDEATVVGSQLGGSLAAWLAARHPERVSRLVVMAAGALGETTNNLTLFRLLAAPLLGRVVTRLFPAGLFATKWAAAHGPGHRPDPEMVAAYHRQLRQRGPAMARFGLGIRRSYGPDFEVLAGPLAGSTVPTLLLFGAEDRQVPPSTGERFAELLPRSRLVLLPGCGDFPQEERPAEVGAALVDFLDAQGASA